MDVKVGDEVFETVPDEVRIAISYLLRVREKAGLNDDTVLEGSVKSSSRSNAVLIRYALEIYRVWASLYPHEHYEFIQATKDELKYERPVKDAIKAGGYSPTSFPMRLERMWGILLPSVKVQDKRFWKPLFSSIPELRRSNYA